MRLVAEMRSYTLNSLLDLFIGMHEMKDGLGLIMLLLDNDEGNESGQGE